MTYRYADPNDGEVLYVDHVAELRRDGNKRFVFVLEDGRILKVPASRVCGTPQLVTR